MNIFQQFTNWLSNRNINKEAKREHELNCLSCDSINVMEYDGKLYISHNGVPIVNADCLSVGITDALVESRKGYLSWKNKFDK